MGRDPTPIEDLQALEGEEDQQDGEEQEVVRLVLDVAQDRPVHDVAVLLSTFFFGPRAKNLPICPARAYSFTYLFTFFFTFLFL